MIPKWQKGVIIGQEQVTPVIRRYEIELKDTAVFDFQPGQFVTLDLPISEQRNKRWRSYSIASAPVGNNRIELIIGLVKDGLGTHYIFEQLSVGDEIRLRGPQGNFLLPDCSRSDLFLICTGTGVAPFHSMVRHIFNHNVPHQHIYLVFGTRTQADLLYLREFRELESSLPLFRYIPVLSREQWDGKTGYVHSIYEELCSQKQAAVFMLCGWRNMVDEAKVRIMEMGFTEREILIELYG